jgi:hypothetical protein
VLRVLRLLLSFYILSTGYNASGYKESSELLFYKSMSCELFCRMRFIALKSPSLKLFISYMFLNSAILLYEERGLFFFDFLLFLPVNII